jgi:ribosomal protein S27AE
MEDNRIRCGRCDITLIEQKGEVSYLYNEIPIDLLVCPKCGQVLILEELAKGKILEIERKLEAGVMRENGRQRNCLR